MTGHWLRRFVVPAMLVLASACAGRAPPSGGSIASRPAPSSNGDAGASEAPRNAIEAIPPPGDDGRTSLRDGWKLTSSSKVKAGGAAIAKVGFGDDDWYVARVPGTVLASLVDAGVYREPYRSDNLRRIPASPFAPSWWYRRELVLPPGAKGERVLLGFDGINYRANVWLNGHLVASERDVRGAFRTYRFDVTNLVDRTGRNALAVEVFRPGPTDLAINWWDWAYSPPDLDMGLFQDVYLRTTGSVALDDLRLTTRVVSPKRAEVTVSAVVTNETDRPREVAVVVELGERSADKSITLGPRETKTLVFDPSTVTAFAIDGPDLWWPTGMGRAALATLSGQVSVEGSLSDRRRVRVGLREITSELSGGVRLFRVNGRPMFLRGGGWASDLLLRQDDARLRTELAYARHLGLNMIRLEGKLDADALYDRADELGLLLLPGWMCCDVWEKQGTWTPAHAVIARESMRSQGARLRNHPSVAAFLVGSDKAPPPEVAAGYRAALEGVEWPNPVLLAASGEGESGLKMPGPYDWVPPSYWLEDKAHGGAFGFNSETGPGAAIAELETLRGFLSDRELVDLWTKPFAPQFHAGAPGHKFETLAIFQKALRARFGPPTSLEDWVAKAQLMNYEAERAELEAFGARKHAGTTGVVHWLFNSPWPSLIWHLSDWSLLPSAAFYGAKKANEPLHAVFGYDDGGVIVVNHTDRGERSLSISARVFALDGAELHVETFSADVGPDAASRAGKVTIPKGGGNVSFVELELRRGSEVESTNTYWVPERADVMNPAATTFVNTPTAEYADLRALMKLPPAHLRAVSSVAADGPDTRVSVMLDNAGNDVAFFVHLTLRAGASGPAVVPVFWNDNYVTLRPGARRTLVAISPTSAFGGRPAKIELEGINVARTTAE